MIGKIFVTGSGCDPVKGKPIKDPYLGSQPSRRACRPHNPHPGPNGDHKIGVSG